MWIKITQIGLIFTKIWTTIARSRKRNSKNLLNSIFYAGGLLIDTTHNSLRGIYRSVEIDCAKIPHLIIYSPPPPPHTQEGLEQSARPNSNLGSIYKQTAFMRSFKRTFWRFFTMQSTLKRLQNISLCILNINAAKRTFNSFQGKMTKLQFVRN